MRYSPAIVAVLVGSSIALASPARAADPVAWQNVVNAVPIGAGSNGLQKTGGCNGCPDAGGNSVQSISAGDGYVEFTATETTTLRFVGISTTKSHDYTAFQWSIKLGSGGVAEVRENNVYRTETAYVSNDVFRIALVSGQVQYSKNAAPPFYTSAILPSYPLYAVASLVGASATFANAMLSGSASLSPWLTQDVGAVGLAGSASQSAGVFTVKGAGADIWGTADGFRFVYQTLTGNGSIVARIDAVQNTHALAKAGLMMRDGLTAGAAHVALDSTPSGQTELLQRSAAGGATSYLGGTTLSLPYWVKLVRTGNTIAAYASQQGSSWTLLGSPATTMSSAIQAGLVVTSHDTTQLNTSTFEQVTLTQGSSGGVPTTYSVAFDTNPAPKPPLPSLGPAGSQFVDPTFGSRIVRVTDANTRPAMQNIGYRTPSASHQAGWNADSTLFYVTSSDGTVIPYSFNPATMAIARLAGPGDGGLTINSGTLEPQFSYLSPNTMFLGGQDPSTNRPLVRKYDFSTNTYTTLLNLGTIPGVPVNAGTYAGYVSSSARSPEKVAVMFGATQDLHPYAAVFTAGPPAGQPVVVNTRDSTITINGVTSPTNITLGFTMHHANIDKSGRYMFLGPQGNDINRGVAPKFVWDLSNNMITAMPKSSLSQGHDSAGFGVLVNGDCCVSTEWDGAQWQLRSLATPLSSSDLIVPTLRPHEGGGAPNGQPGLAEHTSWNNAQDGPLVPVLAELYRWGGITNPWRAWDDEIVAIQTSGATKVWRFAHHRTDTTWDDDPTHSEFEYQPKVNISQNGRWAIFNSNWEKTLGPDAHPPAAPHVTKRRDVFLLELSAP